MTSPPWSPNCSTLFQNVARFPLLHGEVGDVGAGGDLELEDGLGGGGAPVEHRAEDGGEGVARHDGGRDGQLLDERFALLQRHSSRTSPTSPLPGGAAAPPGGSPNATFTQLNLSLRARMRRFNLRHIQLKKKSKSSFLCFGHDEASKFDLKPRRSVRVRVRDSPWPGWLSPDAGLCVTPADRKKSDENDRKSTAK